MMLAPTSDVRAMRVPGCAHSPCVLTCPYIICRVCVCVCVCTQVDDPTKYGVVVMDEYGQVQRFVEKPKVRVCLCLCVCHSKNGGPACTLWTKFYTASAIHARTYFAGRDLMCASVYVCVYTQDFVGDKINAGIYVCSSKVLNRIELRPTSIEREVNTSHSHMTLSCACIRACLRACVWVCVYACVRLLAT